MDQVWLDHKRNWESVDMAVYHENPDNRIGDEIQMTALLGYLTSMGLKVEYRDVCGAVSAARLFPDGLVNFVRENSAGLPKFDPFNLWVWSPFLRDRGFYTSVQKTHDDSEACYDCVFCPCLAPEYNEVRGLLPDNAVAIHRALGSVFRRSVMVVDRAKGRLIPDGTPGVILSDDIYTTFRIVERSSVFVGCDTGTSHYAGAIRHPRMVLLYPDETEVQNRIYWQHQIMTFIFSRPELVRYRASSLPCCDPRQYTTLTVSANAVVPEEVCRAAHSKA